MQGTMNEAEVCIVHIQMKQGKVIIPISVHNFLAIAPSLRAMDSFY